MKTGKAWLAMVVVLGACNSDDGGDGNAASASTTPVQLTETNREQVAHSALGAVDTASAASNPGRSLLAGVQVEGSHQRLSWSMLVARKGLGLLYTGQPASLVPGVVTAQTDTCPAGGQVEYSLNDADQSRGISKGDSVTARFTACRETVDGVSGEMNGSMTMLLNEASGSPLTGTGMFNVTVTIPAPGLSVAVIESGQSHASTIAGDMSMSLQLSRTGAVILTSADSLSASTSDGESLRYSGFSMRASESATGSTVSVNGTIAVSGPAFSGSYTLSMTNPDTPLTFSRNRLYPDSGEVRIQGANGLLTLTVQGNGTLAMTLNADGKTSSKTVGWCSVADC